MALPKPIDPQQQAEAEDLRRQANETMLSSVEKTMGFLTKIFGGGDNKNGEKLLAAGKIFEQAATKFKLAGDYGSAADCYNELSKINTSLDNKYMADNYMEKSAECYAENKNYAKAIAMYTEGVKTYTKDNKTAGIARCHEKIADIHALTKNNEAARSNYALAYQHYAITNNYRMQSMNTCRKLADFCVAGKMYKDAAEYYDKIYNNYINDRTLKFNALSTFCRAAMARMCVDESDGINYYEKGAAQHQSLLLSGGEGSFLKGLVQCFKSEDRSKDFKFFLNTSKNMMIHDEISNMLFTIKAKYFDKEESNQNNAEKRNIFDEIQFGDEKGNQNSANNGNIEIPNDNIGEGEEEFPDLR